MTEQLYRQKITADRIWYEPVEPAARQSPWLEREGLEVAFKPFADFMSATLFDKLSNETRLTAGSPMAWRQLTVGDLRKLSDAILALLSPDMEPKP